MAGNDSSIATNAGSGGDNLDAESVYQEGGTTQVKRERTSIAFKTDDPEGRAVSRRAPLPVAFEDEALALLRQMAGDIREIKVMVAATIDD